MKLLSSWLLLNLGDVATTMVILSSGGVELNPLLATLSTISIPLMVGVKMGLAMILGWAVKSRLQTMRVMCVLMCMVVVFNIISILR